MRGSDLGVDPDTPTRQKIDLSGLWKYTLDDKEWNDVLVPSSFDYEGQMSFVRKFTITEDQLNSSAFKIVALGINHEAQIYINDVFVGRHVGGYTSFEFDVPENVLQLGPENAIKIIVKNQLSPRSTLPLRKQIWGWKNYGGILRDIYLLATPRLWIDGVTITSTVTEDLRQGSIDVSATVSNLGFETARRQTSASSNNPSYQLVIALVDKLSEVLVGQSNPQPFIPQPNRQVEVKNSLLVTAPKLWTPETPDLYKLRVLVFAIDGKQKTIIDEVDRNIGFTSAAIEKNSLFVNGKQTALKGAVWHEDSPDQGASLTYAQMEKDVVMMKTLGANAVRFAFHPPHPYMLKLCSRYGLFALQEIPVWNAPAEILAEESFQVVAETIAREMIQRDRDQIAILAWGIGSDFDSASPRAREYVERMTKFLKSLDGRPVYYGSKMLNNDACADLVDIAALDVLPADVKVFKRLLSMWKERHSEQPVFLSYSREVESNNRNGYSDPMSQEAQAKFFQQYYGVIKEANIAGSFIDSFADWRGDRPIMTVKTNEPYIHPVGLVSQSREKRASYELIKALYNEEKPVALPIGTYRGSFPATHILSGLFVIIVLAYFLNYSRRFSDSVLRALLRPYNFFADLRDLRMVSMAHTVLLAAMLSVSVAVVIFSVFYHYRTDKFVDFIVTQIVPSDALKEKLIVASWHPLQGIAAFSIIFFVTLIVVALLVKLFSALVTRRIYWYHAYAVTVWASFPLVVFAPLGMTMLRLMDTPSFIVLSFLAIVSICVWVFLRLLKGISVIYDVSSARAYSGGLLIGVSMLGLVFLYYESAFAFTSYLQFIVNIAQNLG